MYKVFYFLSFISFFIVSIKGEILSAESEFSCFEEAEEKDEEFFQLLETKSLWTQELDTTSAPKEELSQGTCFDGLEIEESFSMEDQKDERQTYVLLEEADKEESFSIEDQKQLYISGDSLEFDANGLSLFHAELEELAVEREFEKETGYSLPHQNKNVQEEVCQDESYSSSSEGKTEKRGRSFVARPKVVESKPSRAPHSQEVSQEEREELPLAPSNAPSKKPQKREASSKKKEQDVLTQE